MVETDRGIEDGSGGNFYDFLDEEYSSMIPYGTILTIEMLLGKF